MRQEDEERPTWPWRLPCTYHGRSTGLSDCKCLGCPVLRKSYTFKLSPLPLTMAASTPRQSRLASSVRSLLIRACCCTCIGLSLCLTSPSFPPRASLVKVLAIPPSKVLQGSPAVPSCWCSAEPSSPSGIPAQRGETARRYGLLPPR